MNEQLSPQEQIQKFMSEVIEEGNYESAYLFSEEGLTLASGTKKEIIEEDRFVEMAMILQNIQKMADVMGGIDNIRELIIDGNNRRKIVFRFFHAFNQDLVLALIIPPRKTYRGLTNKLVRLVQKIAD